MIGAILCGGNSSRMGVDKGLLKTDGLYWAQISINNLASHAMSTILSVNENQLHNYASHFPNQILLEDKKTDVSKGPVLALLGIHEHFPTEDLFVLACDMPFMKSEIIDELLTTQQKEPNYEAYIFTNDGKAEPLCAIYTARALAKILALYQQNTLERFSMKYLISLLRTHNQPLNNEDKPAFTNFNSPSDLSNFQG